MTTDNSGKRRASGPRGRSGGFTILELLVVIFIMLAMTGIAVAAFRQFLDTERIKLAGGQVVGALRMARQYAMSKRTKVMVEFVEPDYTGPFVSKTTTLAPTAIAYVRGGSYKNKNYGGSALAKWSGGDGSSYHRRGLLKFNLNTIKDVDGVVTKATLKFTASLWTAGDSCTTDVKGLGADGWTQTGVTFNNRPSATGTINTVTVNASTPFEVDITPFAADEARGDGLVSLEFLAFNGSNGYNINSPSLEVEYDEPSDLIGETSRSGHIPRQVRTIPYMRERNQVTGGFSWVLDQDFNSLKMMTLPRNIHYVLKPAAQSVGQYDPGDLVDHKTYVKKVFFNLWPDGTCTAAAPAVEGWTNRVNTLILRDAVTGDLSMLFVPPSSSFTRQRYLFGDEVQAFVAAHSLYSLW